MKCEQLPIAGSWIIDLPTFPDERGHFQEFYKSSDVRESIKVEFEVCQSNVSLSKRGVFRGMHFSLDPKGQEKIISCFSGSMIDVIVDTRINSPSFGRTLTIELSHSTQKAIFLPAGIGHGFLSLDDYTIVNYLVSTEYDPSKEITFSAFNSGLSLDIPKMDYIQSEKDFNAVSLAELKETGQLPIYSGGFD
jgi:dTDP-4-dehydrorhamnose 3,5-epimerase